ncbi:MAG: bifunctional folylpolyglutamate synthase/dihydrofolate synthase [Campylobacterota bacterium]|nr:bifunctional folylpolyglutamate synthase/dihydrofolate synthase [Campylobacterota bacterium]
MNCSTLEEYLNNKPLYYDKIDFDVVKESWDIISYHIKLPYVIHIVGTNGKGSTGRFLASFLNQLEKKVLHYSSPHILEFNERIWIDGYNSTNNQLDFAHEKLQSILNKDHLEKLTYFEYTTLIALVLSHSMDYIVLEAGLGGEFDATNVVKNDLTLLTTIGLDHQEFLGDNIKDITLTKARSCDKAMIIGKQQNSEVINHIRELFNTTREIISIDEQEDINLDFYNKSLPFYLLDNLKQVFCSLNYLNLSITKNLELPKLFGRYEKLTNNITIDVGHNPLAALAISKELTKENKKVLLIYNSYKDKDYENVLSILKPNVIEVQIINCEELRIVEKKTLEDVLNSFNIKYKDFKIKEMKDDINYLIFGSFLVVEEFLKQYNRYPKIDTK